MCIILYLSEFIYRIETGKDEEVKETVNRCLFDCITRLIRLVDKLLFGNLTLSNIASYGKGSTPVLKVTDESSNQFSD